MREGLSMATQEPLTGTRTEACNKPPNNSHLDVFLSNTNRHSESAEPSLTCAGRSLQRGGEGNLPGRGRGRGAPGTLRAAAGPDHVRLCLSGLLRDSGAGLRCLSQSLAVTECMGS